jgi:hypothetical protein
VLSVSVARIAKAALSRVVFALFVFVERCLLIARLNRRGLSF